MKTEKIKVILFRFAWIAVSACVAAFFAISLCVYAKAEPGGVTELLARDGSWLGISDLCVMSGDLEVYSYVTKVYEYSTDNDSVDICWINDDSVSRYNIDYGVVTDKYAERNYCVECFVYSNITDKQLVRRTWGVSVIESDALTLIEGKSPYFNQFCQEIGDIKKGIYNEESNNKLYYSTFIRITIKPGCENVKVDINNSLNGSHTFV